MAGVKISALPASAAPAPDDELVIVDIDQGTDGTTKRLTFSTLEASLDLSSQAGIADNALQADEILISTTSSASPSFLHFGDASSGYDGVEVNSSIFATPSVGSINATSFIGDGSQLTGIAADAVDSAYVQNIVDLSALWASYADGSRTVIRGQGNVYIDATAGGNGYQTYIQGGDQTDIDIVASGGNAYTGLTTNQPWTSLLSYAPDAEVYTSALHGLNGTGMHTRYGHISIRQDSVNYFGSEGQLHLFTGSVETTGTLTSKNNQTSVQTIATTVTGTLTPSSGDLIRHVPVAGGLLTYLYDPDWKVGESVKLHLFTTTNRNIVWPSTYWVDSSLDSVQGITSGGAHIAEIWKTGNTEFFAKYIGRAEQ